MFVLCVAFSRRLFVVCCHYFVCLCFCLVFLSCCMYKRQNSSKTKKKPSRKTQKQKYSSSSQNLRDISLWSSGRLDVLHVLLRCVSLCFVCFVVLCVVCCCLVFVECLPEHNTIHYTKHKQSLNGFVHDLCQMLKLMFKFISNYMTLAADLKVVCIIFKKTRKGASRLGESPFLA